MKTLLITLLLAAAVQVNAQQGRKNVPYHVSYTDQQGVQKCHNGASKEQAERNADQIRRRKGISNVQVFEGKCDRSRTAAVPARTEPAKPADGSMQKQPVSTKPTNGTMQKQPAPTMPTTGSTPQKQPAPTAPTTGGTPQKRPVPTTPTDGTMQKQPAPTAPTDGTMQKQPAPTTPTEGTMQKQPAPTESTLEKQPAPAPKPTEKKRTRKGK